MKEKYVELLLKRCLRLDEVRPLFINYDVINKDFASLIVKYAKKMNVTDIYLNEVDIKKEHDFLLKNSNDEIKESKMFDNSVWDEYAKKDAAFLILDTEIPNLMDDVPSSKIALSSNIRRKTKPLYREKTLKSSIPWCICAVPNEYWAKDLFPNSKDSLKKFWNYLAKITLFDKEEPIIAWDNLLNDRNEKIKVLNELEISKLHYKNSLGTNLTITLPKNNIWQASSSGKWIVNIPSYEIFNTPNYKKTEGIVYSSKPLIYNGKKIDKFFIKFKRGKVIDYKAEVGNDTLKEIIESDKLSSYLGEVALVDYDSPISNTNILFKTTLLDENASCHIALGSGFLECLKDGEHLSKEELDKKGINLSKTHVDFMIGTDDLEIVAETKKGKVCIMKKGNLVV